MTGLYASAEGDAVPDCTHDRRAPVVLHGTAARRRVRHTAAMTSLDSRFPTFVALDVDIYPWLRAAVSATLLAACLVVLGTLDLKAPDVGGGKSRGPSAGDYVELRHRVEGTLPAVRVTSDPAEILARGAAIAIAVRAARRAEQGEVFTPVVAKTVRALITADMARRSQSDRASLMS